MPTITRNNKRNYNTRTRKERQRVYNTTRWVRLRASKLAECPICEICARNGVCTPAIDVHHLTSFMSTEDKIERNRLAFDRGNLQSLCRACHQYQHGQVDASDTPWGELINK